MLDRAKISIDDLQLLTDFQNKRRLFNKYIKEKRLKLFTCPGCGYPSLLERNVYSICIICDWEDDGQDDKEADDVWGGPNGNLSLSENRINIGRNLENHAKALHGKIITDPVIVLQTIDFFIKKKAAVEEKMDGNETQPHPFWAEWKQVRVDLQMALCKEGYGR